MNELEKYSHVWLIWIFHENTNTGKYLKLNQTTQPNNKTTSIVKSKIRPPRLEGKKVGLFSTRTPHRFVPIGLSLVKLDFIDSHGSLHVSGIDLIDGTPILDIKPYIPFYDSIPQATTPEWVVESPRSPFKQITWSTQALQQLTSLVEKLEFYDNLEDIQQTIEQTLTPDIRSTHQRNISKENQNNNKSYSFRLDNLFIIFETTRNEEAIILSIELYSQKDDQKEEET